MINNNETQRKQTELPIDETMSVFVSKDSLYGIVSFTEASNDGKTLTLDDIKGKIREQNITHGIDYQLLEDLAFTRSYTQKYIIAKGTPPVPGVDAYIIPQVELPAEKLTLLENEQGTIDFKNLNLIKNVKKGTVLAIKTPFVPGVKGISVTGKPLPEKKPRDVKLTTTKNTTFSTDGLSIIANTDGQVVFSSGAYDVLNTLVIEGDVDASVGNIDFLGSVLVNGTVKTGYSVKTPKSIEIRGCVEGAILQAGEDVILSRGIQGSGIGKIVAGRNIMSRFIENCTAIATNNIIAETIVQSTVEAGNEILVTNNKGAILGGSAKASSKVSANYIGGPMEIPTSVSIGLSLEEESRLRDLSTKETQVEKKKQELAKNIDFLVKKQLAGTLSKQKSDLLQNLIATKYQLEASFAAEAKELQDLKNQLSRATSGHIEVHKTVYPAVSINIGTSKHFIRERHDRCKIVKSENNIAFNML